MWEFLDWLEKFEISFALVCIKLYVLNDDTNHLVPKHVQCAVNNLQEELSVIIRHYIKFDKIISTPQVI